MRKNLLLQFGVCLVAAAAAGLAQTVPDRLSFEVASVKPVTLDMMKLAAQIQAGNMPKMGPRVDSARAEYNMMAMRELIALAYDVKPFQITGPDWMANTRYDIQAKMPEGATKEQAPKMLQTLLEERFKLVVRRDSAEHAVLALVVAKGGPKLKESPPDPAEDIDENTPLKPGEMKMDTPEGPVRMTVNPKEGSSVVNMGKRGTWTSKMGQDGTLHMEGSKTTMSAFADMLTQYSQLAGGGGRQVVDMTGLQGNYQVALDFSLADLIAMAKAAGVGAAMPAGDAGRGLPADAASEPGGSSSLFNAVQNLGLKLEQRKAPTLQLIIDHVEKTPIEN
ncbi:MAG TPA: TIGR03435 family protein [Bryobacteraceae bacterium]|nr:TIGR03435 family protein [Bryobacteraceae bacterium]